MKELFFFHITTSHFAHHTCLPHINFNKNMKRKIIQNSPTSGSLLISKPSLKDGFFNQSVVMMVEHGEEGSFGFVVNKVIDLSWDSSIINFKGLNHQLFVGGPIMTDKLFFVHTKGELIANSLKITHGLYWGGDIETVKSLIENNKLTQKDIKFFVGYSGWEAEQLDNEIKADTWIIVKGEANDALRNHDSNYWKNMIISLGSQYSDWINYPEHLLMN